MHVEESQASDNALPTVAGYSDKAIFKSKSAVCRMC